MKLLKLKNLYLVSFILILNFSLFHSVKATSHSPISVNGNSELDIFFSGEGTDGLSWNSAHIIEDLEIDASGSGSCIDILNTNRFLIIRNCDLINSGLSFGEAGIALDNCSNVKIEGCNSHNNRNGIFLFDCLYITILNNDLNDNSAYGQSSMNSEYLVLINNRANRNYGGMGGSTESHGYYERNVCSNNQAGGIGVIGGSFNNTFVDNTASNNADMGINIEDSDNNTITGNLSSKNGYYGILLNSDADNNEVYDNIFCENEEQDIFDIGTNNNIYDNTFTCPNQAIPGYNVIFIAIFTYIGLILILREKKRSF
jgi:parallel beta-helix repeat protein